MLHVACNYKIELSTWKIENFEKFYFFIKISAKLRGKKIQNFVFRPVLNAQNMERKFFQNSGIKSEINHYVHKILPWFLHVEQSILTIQSIQLQKHQMNPHEPILQLLRSFSIDEYK